MVLSFPFSSLFESLCFWYTVSYTKDSFIHAFIVLYKYKKANNNDIYINTAADINLYLSIIRMHDA